MEVWNLETAILHEGAIYILENVLSSIMQAKSCAILWKNKQILKDYEILIFFVKDQGFYYVCDRNP